MSDFNGPPTADQFWSGFRIRWRVEVDQMKAEFKYDIAGVDPKRDPTDRGQDLDECFDWLVEDAYNLLAEVNFDYELALYVARWCPEGFWAHMRRRAP